jgi:transmembrane sensor
MEVEVLSTSFNISAYDYGSFIKTSLLKGKVKLINQDSKTATLIPEQEATIDKSAKILVVADGDVEASISWVKGALHFEKADLPAGVRQLARWYDVELSTGAKRLVKNFKYNLKEILPLPSSKELGIDGSIEI